ncbi:MAG: Gfo/Idh/MocA family oxidoreductase [Bacteroidota bacterium]
MQRRNFLKTSAATGAAIAVQPFAIFKNGSPNEKIVFAVMGVRSRGLALAKAALKMKNAEIAYVCDVQQSYMDKCISEVAKIQGKKPKGEKDIRKVLENKDIDAVIMATPDHWHAPGAIMAVKAGKHVYLEKPCGHNPREGELLIEAMDKYNRIIHMGNQRRSWPKVIEAIQALHAGEIGRVYYAKGWYSNNRSSIGFGKPAAIPEGLDYELWQGPAPRTPYRDNIHPYNWHWFRRWGTGEALNNGTHEIDVMRWGLNVDYPTKVVAIGGRYHYQDDWEFPDTMTANYEFEGGKAFSWEGRSCNRTPVRGAGRGNMFYGEKGSMEIIGNGYKIYANDNKNTLLKEEKYEAPKDSTNATSPDADLDTIHIMNLVTGIKDGKPTSSPIAEGHKSVLLCQLANISWFTGRALDIDQRNGHIVGDKEAMKHWGRSYEPGWDPIV